MFVETVGELRRVNTNIEIMNRNMWSHMQKQKVTVVEGSFEEMEKIRDADYERRDRFLEEYFPADKDNSVSIQPVVFTLFFNILDEHIRFIEARVEELREATFSELYETESTPPKKSASHAIEKHTVVETVATLAEIRGGTEKKLVPTGMFHPDSTCALSSFLPQETKEEEDDFTQVKCKTTSWTKISSSSTKKRVSVEYNRINRQGQKESISLTIKKPHVLPERLEISAQAPKKKFVRTYEEAEWKKTDIRHQLPHFLFSYLNYAVWEDRTKKSKKGVECPHSWAILKIAELKYTVGDNSYFFAEEELEAAISVNKKNHEMQVFHWFLRPQRSK